MISVMIMTHEGYIGPKATPIREKQSADPIKEGTNQTTNSRPIATAVLTVRKGYTPDQQHNQCCKVRLTIHKPMFDVLANSSPGSR